MQWYWAQQLTLTNLFNNFTRTCATKDLNYPPYKCALIAVIMEVPAQRILKLINYEIQVRIGILIVWKKMTK